MAKRGRKKNFNINKINDNVELQNMIINQINSLNKKIKSFKIEGVREFEEYYKLLLGDMVNFTSSGTISKSKKQFNGVKTIFLKKKLSALRTINNNDIYGTVNKYKKAVQEGMLKVNNFVTKFLQEKGYSNEFINRVTTNKQFYTQLYLSFNSGEVERYGSLQVIEKVALSYAKEEKFSDKQMEKVLNNLEYSQNTIDRLREEQEALNELLEMRRNGKMR